jgi:RimJ/RimL family protein N-acetyltransferase
MVLNGRRKTAARLGWLRLKEETYAMISPDFLQQIIELGPQHEDKLTHLLLNLDRDSRLSRFNCAAKDALLLQHSRQAMMTTAWLAGMFIDQRLCGVVEVYDMNPPDVVEAALLIDKAWRRLGLGIALVRAAMHWAAEQDRILLRMVFSKSNWPMRGLASRAGAQLDLAFDEVVADLPITQATRTRQNVTSAQCNVQLDWNQGTLF